MEVVFRESGFATQAVGLQIGALSYYFLLFPDFLNKLLFLAYATGSVLVFWNIISCNLH